MKYKEKLLQLIKEGTDQEFQAWLTIQPLLEQTAIMRELKQLGQLPPEEGRGNLANGLKGFDRYNEIIDKYEEAILDQKLAKQLLLMADEDMVKHVQYMRKTYPNLREHIIGCIINKDANALQMRNLAQTIIELEKADNTYHPENWKDLPE